MHLNPPINGPLGSASLFFRRDHLDPYHVDHVLGSLFILFSCPFFFFFFFPRQMFKRQPLRGLAHSVARSSCSLRLTQGLITFCWSFIKFKAIGVNSCGLSNHSFRSGGATQLRIWMLQIVSLKFMADGSLTQLRMDMLVIKSTRGSLCRWIEGYSSVIFRSNVMVAAVPIPSLQ